MLIFSHTLLQAFYASARPIDGAGGIMFLGCPSLCACIIARVCVKRHSLTSLLSFSSLFGNYCLPFDCSRHNFEFFFNFKVVNHRAGIHG